MYVIMQLCGFICTVLVTAPQKIEPSQVLMIPKYIFLLQYLKFNLQVLKFSSKSVMALKIQFHFKGNLTREAANFGTEHSWNIINAAAGKFLQENEISYGKLYYKFNFKKTKILW